MFERIIKALLALLNKCSKEVERAYFETYGDKELAINFNEEVAERRRKNKDLFVYNAAKYIGKQVLERDNYLIPQNIAMQMGEMMFESAKSEGKIDILNNCTEKENYYGND